MSAPQPSVIHPQSSERREPAQNFANHRRFVPLYHFGIFGVLSINVLWALVHVVRHPSWAAGVAFATAAALLGLFFYTRTFALTVQDRVIRLEMRLRLKEVLPADLRARIGELDRDQLIALRFASDAELPDLVREALTNDIHNRDAIKRKIKDWQGDYLRC
jgi:hypothetical protein